MRDDFNLRDLVIALWKGKLIIAVAVVISILISGICSLFLIKPTYEAAANIIVKKSIDPKTQSITEQDLTPFAQQIQSEFMINKIVQKLALGQNSKKPPFNDITVQSNKNSEFMGIKVKGNDPQLITQVANIMAYELSSLVEISANLDLVVIYKQQLREVQEKLISTESELEQTNKELQTTPEKISTKKALSDDPYLQSIVKESTNSSNMNTSAIQMMSEEINPVYTSLKTKSSETAIKLKSLQADNKNLDGKITDSEQKIGELQNKINNTVMKTDIISNSTTSFNSVLITPATTPEDPVGPKKAIIMAGCTIIGGIIGLFLVFFREYWRRSSLPFVSNGKNSVTIV